MGPAITLEDIQTWDKSLETLIEDLAHPLFARSEPRATFTDYACGLLSDVDRKNSWQLAEHAGHRRAWAMEHLLDGARWDHDTLTARTRGYVRDHLAHPDAVLVIDDTQITKKGNRSGGVARQYCGLTGQVENCQTIVTCTYASPAGHTLYDRRLYLPQEWDTDEPRRAAAGMPASARHATKPALAEQIVHTALAEQTPFTYLAGDAGYGRNPGLRAFCHTERIRYVLGVPKDLPLTGPRGQDLTPIHYHAPAAWERRSCGAGSKGQRYYDWATTKVHLKGEDPAIGMEHVLLIRRSVADPDDEVDYFLAHALPDTPVTELVAVAGARWTIETDHEIGKDLVGLGEYQVRKWTPWHRHTAIAVFVQAFLAVQRAERGKQQGGGEGVRPTGLRQVC